MDLELTAEELLGDASIVDQPTGRLPQGRIREGGLSRFAVLKSR